MRIESQNNLSALRLVNQIKQTPQIAGAQKAYSAQASAPPAATYHPSAPQLPSAVNDAAAMTRLNQIQASLVAGQTTVPIHFEQSAQGPKAYQPAVKAYSRFLADAPSVNESQTRIEIDA